MSIGELLMKRRAMRVGQREVAKQMRVNLGTIVDWERGNAGLTDHDALRLEEALNEIERSKERKEVSAIV